MAEPVLVLAATAGVLVALTRRRRRRPPPVVVEPDRPSGADPEPAAGDLPEHDTPDDRIAEIEQLLAELVTDSPRPGHLYQVQTGDDLPGLVAKALSTVGATTALQREHYLHCLSSDPVWNLRNYGSPSTSLQFPASLLAPGIGQGLRVAFLPRNADALAFLRAGTWPPRTTDPTTGARTADGSSLGLLWFPPTDEQAILAGELPTCAPFSWADGSSALHPPPELLERLRVHDAA